MSRSGWVPSGLAYRSMVLGGDAGRGVTGGLGALGGVFGQVAGDGQVGEVPVPRRVMTRMSISVPQAMSPAAGPGRVRRGAVADRAGGPAGGVLQVGDGDAGRRGQQPVRVGGVVAVEAEQGVEVDRAAGLVFGGLAVRDADRVDQAVLAVAAGDPDRGDAAAAGELAEVAFDGLLGAPPQFAGAVVPDHVGGVVVAVRAQRLAEFGVLVAVPGEAGGGAAVRAGGGIAAGVAGPGPAGAAGPVGAGVLADGAGVDRPEGRGGEGDEDGGVGGDGRGDAFAAGQPGADELVGVAPVGLGAAGAGGGAPVPARLVDHAVRHADRGDGAQELAGGRVDVLDVAAQPDGAGTGGGVPDVIEPGVVSGGVQPGEDAFIGELEVHYAGRAAAGLPVVMFRSCERGVRCSPPCPGPGGFRAREPAAGWW